MKMVIVAIQLLLRCVTVYYPSTEQSKYFNCTVNSSKHLEPMGRIKRYTFIITIKHT